ncbi:hypothetical protein DAPPUDRAFT_99617 [Daphnia pulex]|uniref:Uncharacterized protein n=1 Tax=Daphnia pulex TaxID=6669 RepID=E9G7F2_DAPPU|nr:hypothetical protein DAPPUDRAFT_99617 [Daphnia pulex]|eukprot:EFX84656.1 hypothetical protein DAPPUDRAFT_99617 [Daphnia pulex]
MESNSPGGQSGGVAGGDEEMKKKQEARRARSRSRTRTGLSSRVSFFESGAQDRNRKRSPSKSFDRTDSSLDISMEDCGSGKLEDSVFDQSEIDQLEREIILRRQRLSRREDEEERQRRPAVSLRRVVSPVRVESVAMASSSSFHSATHQVVNQQFATEVYISSWTERTAASSGGRSSDPAIQTPPTPPPRDISQPPWRLARRSEPATTATTPESSTPPFASPTTPTSAFTKYQEWRTRRLTSAESADQVAPWRKQQQSRREPGGQPASTSPFGEVITLRRASATTTAATHNESGEQQNSPSSSRKSSQLPPWYSEYRTASLSQTASRMEGFRVGGIKTHYDFHITQIKGMFRRLSSSPRARIKLVWPGLKR